MQNKRRDGVRVKGLDGYHNILPYVMPKRTEAEVSMTEQFDVTDLVSYMKKRNEVFSSLLFLNAIFVATVIVLLIICIQIIPTLNQYKYLFVSLLTRRSCS